MKSEQCSNFDFSANNNIDFKELENKFNSLNPIIHVVFSLHSKERIKSRLPKNLTVIEWIEKIRNFIINWCKNNDIYESSERSINVSYSGIRFCIKITHELEERIIVKTVFKPGWKSNSKKWH